MPLFCMFLLTVIKQIIYLKNTVSYHTMHKQDITYNHYCSVSVKKQSVTERIWMDHFKDFPFFSLVYEHSSLYTGSTASIILMFLSRYMHHVLLKNVLSLHRLPYIKQYERLLHPLNLKRMGRKWLQYYPRTSLEELRENLTHVEPQWRIRAGTSGLQVKSPQNEPPCLPVLTAYRPTSYILKTE
jgi:hypothetical protein